MCQNYPCILLNVTLITRQHSIGCAPPTCRPYPIVSHVGGGGGLGEGEKEMKEGVSTHP